MTNPYDKKAQEALFNSWEHGFGAKDESENPYDEGSDADPKWITAWKEGYRANMGRPKKSTKKVEKDQIQPELLSMDLKEPTYDFVHSESTLAERLSTELLVHELVKRKKDEYDKMVGLRNELNRQIAKLEALFEL